MDDNEAEEQDECDGHADGDDDDDGDVEGASSLVVKMIDMTKPAMELLSLASPEADRDHFKRERARWLAGTSRRQIMAGAMMISSLW